MDELGLIESLFKPTRESGTSCGQTHTTQQALEQLMLIMLCSPYGGSALRLGLKLLKVGDHHFEGFKEGLGVVAFEAIDGST